MSRHIAHLWHWYQPPTQSDYWVKLIADECYLWKSKWLSEQDPSRFKVNININASLTSHLLRLGLDEILQNLGRAAQKGVVEFVESLACHQVAPVLPDKIRRDVVRRQIDKNRKINSSAFGAEWNTKIFFPPEMAFSPELAGIIKDEGLEAAITEDAVFDAGRNDNSIPYDYVAIVSGIPTFFRSGEWSRKFAMEFPDKYPRRDRFSELPGNVRHTLSIDCINDYMDKFGNGVSSWFNNGYVIKAYDGETIGHHQRIYSVDALNHYVWRMEGLRLKPAHLSEILQIYIGRKELHPSSNNPLIGTWSTTVENIKEGNPFPLWNNRQNALHQRMHSLIECVARYMPTHPITNIEREAVDKAEEGLSSCHLWSCNPQGLWNPALIKRGAEYLKIAGEKLGVPDVNDKYIAVLNMLN